MGSLLLKDEKRAVFRVRDKVQGRYVLGTKICNQRTAVFCADCTSEADISQSYYYGVVHVLWVILVRTNRAFV